MHTEAARKKLFLSNSTGQRFTLLGASVDMNFAAGAYFGGTVATMTSTTRASSGYAQTAAGLLVNFAANTPRITDQGLLVEEARTNLALRSQGFANATWSKSQINEATSVVNAPDGTATASTITPTAGGTVHDLFQALAAANGTYSESIWMRAGASNFGFINLQSGANYLTIVVNLATGAVTQTAAAGLASLTSSSVSAYVNGWYRVNLTGTLGAAIAYVCVGVAGAATGNTFNGGGEVVFSTAAGTENIHIWGFQLELGAFATSYIPTTTVAVTRAADVITLTGAAATAALAAKAAYFETNGVAGGTFPRFADYSGGLQLYFNSTTQVSIFSGTTATATIGGAGTYAGLVKAAYGFDATSRTVKANGGTAATDANAVTGQSGTVTLGNNAGGNRALNGYLKRGVLGPTFNQFGGITA